MTESLVLPNVNINVDVNWATEVPQDDRLQFDEEKREYDLDGDGPFRIENRLDSHVERNGDLHEQESSEHNGMRNDEKSDSLFFHKVPAGMSTIPPASLAVIYANESQINVFRSASSLLSSYEVETGVSKVIPFACAYFSRWTAFGGIIGAFGIRERHKAVPKPEHAPAQLPDEKKTELFHEYMDSETKVFTSEKDLLPDPMSSFCGNMVVGNFWGSSLCNILHCLPRLSPPEILILSDLLQQRSDLVVSKLLLNSGGVGRNMLVKWSGVWRNEGSCSGQCDSAKNHSIFREKSPFHSIGAPLGGIGRLGTDEVSDESGLLYTDKSRDEYLMLKRNRVSRYEQDGILLGSNGITEATVEALAHYKAYWMYQHSSHQLLLEKKGVCKSLIKNNDLLPCFLHGKCYNHEKATDFGVVVGGFDTYTSSCDVCVERRIQCRKCSGTSDRLLIAIDGCVGLGIDMIHMCQYFDLTVGSDIDLHRVALATNNYQVYRRKWRDMGLGVILHCSIQTLTDNLLCKRLSEHTLRGESCRAEGDIAAGGLDRQEDVQLSLFPSLSKIANIAIQSANTQKLKQRSHSSKQARLYIAENLIFEQSGCRSKGPADGTVISNVLWKDRLSGVRITGRGKGDNEADGNNEQCERYWNGLGVCCAAVDTPFVVDWACVSPPWGGVGYDGCKTADGEFCLGQHPQIIDIIARSARIARNVCLYLPRSLELQSMLLLACMLRIPLVEAVQVFLIREVRSWVETRGIPNQNIFDEAMADLDPRESATRRNARKQCRQKGVRIRKRPPHYGIPSVMMLSGGTENCNSEAKTGPRLDELFTTDAWRDGRSNDTSDGHLGGDFLSDDLSKGDRWGREESDDPGAEHLLEELAERYIPDDLLTEGNEVNGEDEADGQIIVQPLAVLCKAGRERGRVGEDGESVKETLDALNASDNGRDRKEIACSSVVLYPLLLRDNGKMVSERSNYLRQMRLIFASNVDTKRRGRHSLFSQSFDFRVFCFFFEDAIARALHNAEAGRMQRSKACGELGEGGHGSHAQDEEFDVRFKGWFLDEILQASVKRLRSG